MDWFNPFKHTKHSEGAIYLSIMNLPRKERFLQENIILAGVIPGPREPSRLMNSLLNPLVKELKKLWRGVILKDYDNRPIMVRAALLYSSCDVPAGRKVCGFVGHSALRGAQNAFCHSQHIPLVRNLITLTLTGPSGIREQMNSTEVLLTSFAIPKLEQLK